MGSKLQPPKLFLFDRPIRTGHDVARIFDLRRLTIICPDSLGITVAPTDERQQATMRTYCRQKQGKRTRSWWSKVELAEGLCQKIGKEVATDRRVAKRTVSADPATTESSWVRRQAIRKY